MKPAFQAHGYWIAECGACGHRSANVANDRQSHVTAVYDDSYFSDGGAGYANYLQEADLLRERGRTYGWLTRRYTDPGRLLDVGAAAGFVLRGFLDTNWSGIGVEPNPAMAEFARSHVGVDVRCSAFEDFRSEERFDMVSMIQVVAHFMDPGEAIRHAASFLRPGGVLLIETWDRRSWTARLFGKYWHEYSPPSVLHWFSKTGLRGLAVRHGLIEVARGRPQRSILLGHAVSLIRHKTNVAGAFLDALPKGLSAPYPGDDLFWAIYRKSGV